MPYHREQPMDNGSVSELIFRTHKKKINLNLVLFHHVP